MTETTFEIEVQDDHVEKISQTRKPILALSELIWNALDAKASAKPRLALRIGDRYAQL